MRQLHFKVLPAVFIAMAMLIFLTFSVPSVVQAEKMTFEERLEMKKRVMKQQEAGQVPQVEPGMSFEERLYIKKKQQDMEKQQQQQAQPQPPRHQPPSPPPPQPRTQEQRQRHDSGDSYQHHPGSRPPDRHYSPPPEARHRPPPSHHRSFDFNDHRRRHCLRIWEGRGYQYNRCMDGDYVYMYPSRSHDRDTSIFIGIPTPPPIIRYQQPMWPERMRSGRFPTWYMPLVSDDATITAQDSDRNYRSFHLLGIRTGDDQEFTASCISRNLTDSSIQVNEIVTTRRHERADVEAVVISNNAILNIQVLADGCAEFDDADCNDMGQDFCDNFRDAEEYARRNRIGIWR